MNGGWVCPRLRSVGVGTGICADVRRWRPPTVEVVSCCCCWWWASASQQKHCRAKHKVRERSVVDPGDLLRGGGWRKVLAARPSLPPLKTLRICATWFWNYWILIFITLRIWATWFWNYWILIFITFRIWATWFWNYWILIFITLRIWATLFWNYWILIFVFDLFFYIYLDILRRTKWSLYAFGYGHGTNCPLDPPVGERETSGWIQGRPLPRREVLPRVIL